MLIVAAASLTVAELARLAGAAAEAGAVPLTYVAVRPSVEFAIPPPQAGQAWSASPPWPLPLRRPGAIAVADRRNRSGGARHRWAVGAAVAIHAQAVALTLAAGLAVTG